MFEYYADLEEILEDRLNDQTNIIDSTEKQQDKAVVVGSDKTPPLRKKASPVAVSKMHHIAHRGRSERHG